jgi:hypothetical protein
MIKGINSEHNQRIHDQARIEFQNLKARLNVLPMSPGDIVDLRLRYLQGSDWTQTDDAPITAEKKAEWAAYRQALRNIDPNNFSGWPQYPE